LLHLRCVSFSNANDNHLLKYAILFTCLQLNLLDCNGFGDTCQICDFDPSFNS